jgi:hypothetical protein
MWQLLTSSRDHESFLCQRSVITALGDVAYEMRHKRERVADEDVSLTNVK